MLEFDFLLFEEYRFNHSMRDPANATCRKDVGRCELFTEVKNIVTSKLHLDRVTQSA